jgi:hypothetical protein
MLMFDKPPFIVFLRLLETVEMVKSQQPQRRPVH